MHLTIDQIVNRFIVGCYTFYGDHQPLNVHNVANIYLQMVSILKTLARRSLKFNGRQKDMNIGSFLNINIQKHTIYTL